MPTLRSCFQSCCPRRPTRTLGTHLLLALPFKSSSSSCCNTWTGDLWIADAAGTSPFSLFSASRPQDKTSCKSSRLLDPECALACTPQVESALELVKVVRGTQPPARGLSVAAISQLAALGPLSPCRLPSRECLLSGSRLSLPLTCSLTLPFSEVRAKGDKQRFARMLLVQMHSLSISQQPSFFAACREL